MDKNKSSDGENIWRYHLKKWIPTVIFFPIMIWLVVNRGTYTWIDNADLVIHEAGHFIFRIFGTFIYTLGGTLMQILLPSLIIWYFIRNNYQTGAQVAMLWLGQNLVNISVYAADARAQALPLLGGNKVYHDWNYLLDSANLLQYDAEVGYFFFGLAIIIFITTALLPLIFQK